MMFNFYKLCHNSTCRYYSRQWLDESHDCVPPHRDMKVVKEKNNVLRDIFQVKLKRGEQMRSMLLFLHAWKIFLVVIPSMTSGT